MSGCGPGEARCLIHSVSHEHAAMAVDYCPRHAAVDKLVEALEATELVLIFGLLEEKADDLRNEIKEALRAAGEVRDE